MIYQNILFHNVGDLTPVAGREGLLLQRLPREAEAQVRPGTAEKCRTPANVELRFVPQGEVTISLMCYEDDLQCAIYAGDYQLEEYRFQQGPIELSIPNRERLLELGERAERRRFAPQVIRVVFFARFSKLHFLSVHGSLRPPRREELPEKCYLAYGTSITQGYNACSPMLTYAAQAAWRMGWDLLNLGVGGQGFCEEAMAHHIAQRGDWDVFSACISVNMLNLGVSAEEFRNTAARFFAILAESNPGKPLYAISVLPFFADQGVQGGAVPVSTPEEYRNALWEVCQENPQCKFIDGTQLLSFCNLTGDLIHPGTLGMIEIGERLAKIFAQEELVD